MPISGIQQPGYERERTGAMSSVFRMALVVAGLALFATTFTIFPRDGTKGLAKGLAVSVSLAIVAALLITAARTFGP
jgi:hypothetical protein